MADKVPFSLRRSSIQHVLAENTKPTPPAYAHSTADVFSGPSGPANTPPPSGTRFSPSSRASAFDLSLPSAYGQQDSPEFNQDVYMAHPAPRRSSPGASNPSPRQRHDSVGPPTSNSVSPDSEARAAQSNNSPSSNLASAKPQGIHAPFRTSASPSLPHGTKRKLSHDRGQARQPGDEIDPQLIGPGVPSSVETPAAKRRGSIVDPTAHHRRLSPDARQQPQQPQPPPPPTAAAAGQWWPGERRDSTSSMFSSSGVSHGSPAFSGEPPHGPPPPGPPFPPPWPQAFDHANPPRDPDGRHFDPSGVPPPIGMPSFPADRRMSVPTNLPSSLQAASDTASRVLRSRSRPPSRTARAAEASSSTQQPSASAEMDAEAGTLHPPPPPMPSSSSSRQEGTGMPYSRSPELRVSHKLAERKRRKEMKELFDELRDQLPADRAMKASKWEILSKAIDFINQLKQHNTELARDVDGLRSELEGIRHGMHFPPGAPMMYTHHPGVYPPPPGMSALAAPHAGPGPAPPPPQSVAGMHQQPSAPPSRPDSSQARPGTAASVSQNGDHLPEPTSAVATPSS